MLPIRKKGGVCEVGFPVGASSMALEWLTGHYYGAIDKGMLPLYHKSDKNR
jgi:hypothetical protein